MLGDASGMGWGWSRPLFLTKQLAPWAEEVRLKVLEVDGLLATSTAEKAVALGELEAQRAQVHALTAAVAPLKARVRDLRRANDDMHAAHARAVEEAAAAAEERDRTRPDRRPWSTAESESGPSPFPVPVL